MKKCSGRLPLILGGLLFEPSRVINRFGIIEVSKPGTKFMRGQASGNGAISACGNGQKCFMVLRKDSCSYDTHEIVQFNMCVNQHVESTIFSGVEIIEKTPH